MLAASKGKTNLLPSLSAPSQAALRYPRVLPRFLPLELGRSCSELGRNGVSPCEGGADLPPAKQGCSAGHHRVCGLSAILLPGPGKLPPTTTAESSPKPLSPDFPMASPAPGRRGRLRSAAHRNISPTVSAPGAFCTNSSLAF